jgi:hypothetical protein
MIIANYNIRNFCVTLQELPEKWQFISKHFKEMGFDCEPFNGISANESGLVTEHTYDVDNPGTNYRIGRKPVATWLSFYMLWSAMQYMNEHYFGQLEWDCHLVPNWRPRLEQALKDVPPDFDILMAGNCCCKGKPMKHIKGEVYEMKGANCGHFSIIAKKALPTLLSTQRKVYAPLDLSLCYHSFPRLKVYVILPRIADQFDTAIPV